MSSTNSEAVIVVINCNIQLGKAEMARKEFEAIIKTVVTNEAACHGIRLHMDPEEPHRLLLIEHWDSKGAFTGAHMQTPHMQGFLGRAAEFFAGTPEFGFWREIAAAS